jgi:hypothetical protein
MKAEQILQQVKTALGMQTEVKLAQAKLDNGTVLEAEVFEPGAEIAIVNDEERVPLPAGEYMMEDGRQLVIAEDGIISAINEMPAEEEEAPEVEVEVEAAEDEKPVTRMEFEELKRMVATMVEMMEAKEVKASAETEAPAPAEEPSEKVEMAAIKHSPEKKAEKENSKIILSKRKMTTLDRVLKTIAEI